MNKLLNPEEIRKWHSIFKPNGELFEIRILGDKTYSGYFYDIEKALELLPRFDNGVNQFYFTVNEINPACDSRAQFNTFMLVKGSATSDNDIVKRTWLAVDIDCEKPSNVSSSKEEKEYAHQKAVAIYRLLKEYNFPEAIVCDSSSGYHMYYFIDMSDEGESKKIIDNFYTALSNLFTDERVKIDRVISNKARIMRLYGSWGRKGRDSEERPHRMAKILRAPSERQLLTKETIVAFSSKFCMEEEKKQPIRSRGDYRGGNEDFDLRKFIADNGIRVAKELPFDNGGTKFVLEECPFSPEHKAPDSAIFLFSSGAISFKCLHNSCADHDWRELRLKFDPHAYDHENEQFQTRMPYAYQQPIPQKPKYQIKEENPELGKKWFSLSDIKKIDLSSIKTMKTGFYELDKAIGGLAEGEVSILSGSNSSGKSSWLNSVSLNVINGGGKVALWSGELRPDILKTWIQLVAAGRHNVKPSKYDDRYYVPNEVSQKIDEWLDGKFFLYNNEYSAKWEQIFNDMNELLTLGVSLFVLDNLFSLDIDVLNGDKNNKQKELIIQICQFAKKNSVHIILVCHPRKTSMFLRKNDISGSADLSNAVDNVFIVHRVNTDFRKGLEEFTSKENAQHYEQYGNVVEVAKNRMYGVVDRMFGMYYDISTRRFMNTQNEEFRYDWEHEPQPVSVIEEPSKQSADWNNPDMLHQSTEEVPF